MGRATNRTALQARSKLAFNREHRLTIVSYFIDHFDDLVDKKSLASATGVSDSTVYAELRSMAALDLLSLTIDGSRDWFAPIDGPFWRWAAELVDEPSLLDHLGRDSEVS